MLTFRWLKKTDTDLDIVIADLQDVDWDKADIISEKQIELLRQFLGNPDNFYIVGYVDGEVAGRVFGYLHLHPNGSRAVYVDEVDTLGKYYRKGVASGMLEQLKKYAKKVSADEIWVGTEADNDRALAFYRSTKPSEEEASVIFAYNVKD